MLIGIDANPLLSEMPGGIEVYVDRLVRYFPQVGPRHRYRLYFNYFRSHHAARVRAFRASGIDTRVCRVPLQIMAPARRYARVPLEWLGGKVDVMLYQCLLPGPQRNGRTAITLHDIIPKLYPEYCESRMVDKYAARLRSSAVQADTIITVSQYSAKTITDHFGVPREKVHVVPNGIDERFATSTVKHRVPATLARYGITSSYVLFVGTHEPRKNIPRLVQACAALSARLRRRHVLVLAGKPAWGEPAVAEAIRKCDRQLRVLRIGHVASDDLVPLYAGAAAFCFPSLAEGFGIPPLEAMACGVPVVASDIPALREVLGKAAVLIDPWSVDALRDAIARVLEDDIHAATLRACGTEHARSYSWRRTAQETLAVLERAAR